MIGFNSAKLNGTDPDTMTGLSFFICPSSETYLVAVFDEGVSKETLESARVVLSKFGEESSDTLEDIAHRLEDREFIAAFVGIASKIFLER